ncbi:hypothetical protein C0993_007581 [Termitomyces sp. T159_Od127]|nr:hypothetical protein C0993_007581 [Termitomyces sp. T159_Od127]
MEVIVDDANGECTDELGIVSDDPGEDEIVFVKRGDVGKFVVPDIGRLIDVGNDNTNVDDDEMKVSVEDGVTLGVLEVNEDVAIVIDVDNLSGESEDSEVIVGGVFEDIDDRAVGMVVSEVEVDAEDFWTVEAYFESDLQVAPPLAYRKMQAELLLPSKRL